MFIVAAGAAIATGWGIGTFGATVQATNDYAALVHKVDQSLNAQLRQAASQLEAAQNIHTLEEKATNTDNLDTALAAAEKLRTATDAANTAALAECTSSQSYVAAIDLQSISRAHRLPDNLKQNFVALRETAASNLSCDTLRSFNTLRTLSSTNILLSIQLGRVNTSASPDPETLTTIKTLAEKGVADKERELLVKTFGDQFKDFLSARTDAARALTAAVTAKTEGEKSALLEKYSRIAERNISLNTSIQSSVKKVSVQTSKQQLDKSKRLYAEAVAINEAAPSHKLNQAQFGATLLLSAINLHLAETGEYPRGNTLPELLATLSSKKYINEHDLQLEDIQYAPATTKNTYKLTVRVASGMLTIPLFGTSTSSPQTLEDPLHESTDRT